MTSKSAKTTKPASKAAIKTSAKPKIAAKSPGKAAAKPKVAPKATPKVPAKKIAAKPVAKKVLKPVAKAKAAAKPVAKVNVKKPLVKTKVPAKMPAKTVLKAAAKPVAKKPAKAVLKTVAKTAAKAPVKALVKAPANLQVKLAVKPVAKVALKAAGKTTTNNAAKLEKALPAGKKAVAPAPAPIPQAPKPAAVLTSNGLPPPPPLKPGRRSSSRALAHMPPPAPMVPTHAPDAAKASYSTMTERVIAPPPHVAAKKDPKLANNWKTKTAQTLTDEEVKAMPDAEYMNDMQMAFFRHKLSILKQDIHNSAGATTEHLREDTVVVPDPADRATIEEEHALELRTRDRERKLLKKIEQSIARIDSGDYGYCDETGEPIGVGRLIARPTASLSLEAQQRRELKQKMFGD